MYVSSSWSLSAPHKSVIVLNVNIYLISLYRCNFWNRHVQMFLSCKKQTYNMKTHPKMYVMTTSLLRYVKTTVWRQWRGFKDVISLTLYPTNYAHGLHFVVFRCALVVVDFTMIIFNVYFYGIWLIKGLYDCFSFKVETLKNMCNIVQLRTYNKSKTNQNIILWISHYIDVTRVSWLFTFLTIDCLINSLNNKENTKAPHY